MRFGIEFILCTPQSALEISDAASENLRNFGQLFRPEDNQVVTGDAMAYFGVLKPIFEKHELGEEDLESAAANTAIAIHAILEKHKKVHFWDDEDAQKQAVNEIDDYLYDELKTERGIELSLDQMDDIIEKVLQVAKHRSYK